MRWRRMVFLLLAAAVYTTFMTVAAAIAVYIMQSDGPVSFEDLSRVLEYSFTDRDSLRILWLPAMVFTATQFMFLLPVFSPKLAPTKRGRSLRWSIAAAGLTASLLFIGMVTAVAELLLLTLTGQTDAGELIHEVGLDRVFDHNAWVWWPYVLVSWMIWIPALMVFTRRWPACTVHGQLVKWLLAGTLIEVIVVLPLDIMVRRKSNCYCNTGTFMTLTMSLLALLWLAGPGIVLALTSKRRQSWLEIICPNCGYEKGPTPASKCPECNAQWDRPN